MKKSSFDFTKFCVELIPALIITVWWLWLIIIIGLISLLLNGASSLRGMGEMLTSKAELGDPNWREPEVIIREPKFTLCRVVVYKSPMHRLFRCNPKLTKRFVLNLTLERWNSNMK